MIMDNEQLEFWLRKDWKYDYPKKDEAPIKNTVEFHYYKDLLSWQEYCDIQIKIAKANGS